MPNMPARQDDPLRGKKSGKWSRYGGAVYGLVKEAIQDNWYCQVCGSENPKELKPFLFELFPGEFVRVCSLCTNVVNRTKTRITITRLITTVRKTKDY